MVNHKDPEVPEFEDADEDTVDASRELDRLGQSVVWATDWTTETIVTQLQRGAIELRPRFQRRDAWTEARKSKFIESLVLGLPVPQIVLAERREKRGSYIVLDGKQRLLSLLQFFGLADGGRHNSFALSELEILGDQLLGRRLEDIKADPDLRDYYDAFANQPIRALIIRNWPDELFLHLVFLRLNTGSVKLSSQELRQALYPGEFSDYVDDASRVSRALQRVLGLEEPDFRMRDVEVLLRHIAFKRFLGDYRGELKVFLDDASRKLNRNWAAVEDSVKLDVEQFEMATESLVRIFGEKGVARRPEGLGRRRFNRAIFDVQIYYLTDEVVRAAAIKMSDDVKCAFGELWAKDDAFVRSVETTTKSLEATHKRFSAWGEALRCVVGVDLRIPRLRDNRLIP